MLEIAVPVPVIPPAELEDERIATGGTKQFTRVAFLAGNRVRNDDVTVIVTMFVTSNAVLTDARTFAFDAIAAALANARIATAAIRKTNF